MPQKLDAPNQIYDPERHDPILDEAWSPERATEEIHRIVDDFESALRDTGDWPTHPLEDRNSEPKWALYSGAAGAVVSLRLLRKLGYCIKDHSELLPRIHAAYLQNPDYGYETGLQLGEIGILTPAVLADPADRAPFDRLVHCMQQTVEHPARETTSGATGMMHAALTLFRHTQNEIWKDLFLAGAHALWQSWLGRPNAAEWLWASQIFGATRSYYGACHGIAGNVHALLRGIDLLPNAWIEPIVQRTSSTLAHAAVREHSYVNWPLSADRDSVGSKRLLHWCHGAPGVVTGLTGLPQTNDADVKILDDLMTGAGELTWHAGPLKKGAGLCHGTAGNGFAFLMLYQRTGEERWLERARRFAMHAIYQCRKGRDHYQQGRYTLWTGDGGLAVYLNYCLRPESILYPGLEAY